MKELKEAYSDFVNGWQDMTAPKSFDFFEAGFYHAKRIKESMEVKAVAQKYKEIEKTIDDIYTYDDLSYVAMLLKQQLKDLRGIKDEV